MQYFGVNAIISTTAPSDAYTTVLAEESEQKVIAALNDDSSLLYLILFNANATVYENPVATVEFVVSPTSNPTVPPEATSSTSLLAASSLFVAVFNLFIML